MKAGFIAAAGALALALAALASALTGCSRSGGPVVVSVVRASADAGIDPVVDARSSSGALLLVRSHASAEGAALVARLGSAPAAHKLVNPVAFLDAIEASPESDPALRVYLQVDRTRVTREGLTSLGFEPNTVAGDIATGRVRVSALERVLASDMVRYVELAQGVRLR